MIPITFKRKNETKTEYIKRYTNLLYDQLPQTTLEERAQYTEIRDKVIELNYAFFGYVVSNKFLNNWYASYEDKIQACIARFCTCWTWYKFEKKYRTDLSFTVFYTPRLGEMLERDFNEVQYSLRRSLCLKVGTQLGKPWTKVTYEDLSDPRLNLPPETMASLMAIFGTLNPGYTEEISPYLEAPEYDECKELNLTDEYNDIVSLLIREMVTKEKKLTSRDLNKFSEIYGIPTSELKAKVPVAEAQLHSYLLNMKERRKYE